ncbi:hypothetical protein C8F01DRAFT_776995 [Mycena amicta]|nr:hypothetical protein C8F01DRAFT_776995 [Mycena amicta]
MSQMSGARPSPSAPRLKTAKPLATQTATWFQAIFKTKEYNLSQIKGCLMVEIDDLVQNMSQLLSERTKVELLNTKDNDLAKVDILFKTIDSRPGDIQLLSSFCRELARLVGIRSMLRFKLEADDSDYEEILARELLGSSGAAYRREGLRRSIAQSELTARAHLHSGTSSKAGRANANSARVGRRNEHLTLPRRPGAASDSEAAAKHSNFDSAPETMLLRDITFTEELGSGMTFFVHSAKHRGRPVIVKVFNATANPRQLVEREIQLANKLIHPNLLRLEGVSAPSSPAQFITYQPGTTADRPLGTALDANLETSVALGLQMVGELAAGLNYLHMQRIAIQCIKITHFSVLFDSDQKFLIALDPTALDEAPSSSSPVDIDILWRYFNELCEFVFMSANRLIHDDIDNVKRDADRVDLSNRARSTQHPQ